MQAMMQACPLDTWRAICERAVVEAKRGDAKARDWLAKYLVGDPGHQAPAPMAVVVQQLTGIDPALNRAAELVATGGDFLGMASPDEIEKARAAILLAEQAIENKPGA